jgi:hypothetical protein
MPQHVRHSMPWYEVRAAEQQRHRMPWCSNEIRCCSAARHRMPWCSNEVRAAAPSSSGIPCRRTLRNAAVPRGTKSRRRFQTQICSGSFQHLCGIICRSNAAEQSSPEDKAAEPWILFCKTLFPYIGMECRCCSADFVAAPRHSMSSDFVRRHRMPLQRTSYDGIECRCSGLLKQSFLHIL